MPRIITFAELKDTKKIFNESELIKSASQFKPEKNVFLSHSSNDIDLLPYIITIIENHDGNVYIDKSDKNLPAITCRKTAAILKDEINKINKFIVFVTPNSKNSRWVPWELGLADGLKSMNDIALFPSHDVANNQNNWIEQEYLGLYNSIQLGRFEGKTTYEWMVYNLVTTYSTPLREWILKR